jgi:hypothetical protein
MEEFGIENRGDLDMDGLRIRYLMEPHGKARACMPKCLPAGRQASRHPRVVSCADG